jgi:formylglycine-generating enzyme
MASHGPIHGQSKDQPNDFTNSLGMKFVWIPSGKFMMGSPKQEEERLSNEAQHNVTLSNGFFMGIHLVTQEEWQTVMGNKPSGFKGEKNLPVDSVSWNDCQEFIKKLREKDEKPYRLTSEAEWEYCCRAGTTTPFNFGGTISTDQANYCGNLTYGNGKKCINRERTTPVGTFPANAWGLHDMHGNLWEWCQDCCGDYPQNDVVDPQGSESEADHRILRGGSWYSYDDMCRSARRSGSEPAYSTTLIGFRICFSVE